MRHFVNDAGVMAAASLTGGRIVAASDSW